MVAGVTDSLFAVQYLHTYLVGSTRLPSSSTFCQGHPNWSNLEDVFLGNLDGAYLKPGNSWDLFSCKRKKGKQLCNYIIASPTSGTTSPTSPNNKVIDAFMK